MNTGFGTQRTKREELERLMLKSDEKLSGLLGEHIRAAGHCLVLGRHYAESPYVYFSLNPGFARDGSPLNPQSTANANVPFLNPPHLRRQYVYLHNCERFLNDHQDLGVWMNAQVTSAFLVPWRTRNASDLFALNRASRGECFALSRQLVRMILRHHQARLLIVAGKSAIELLNQLGVFDQPVEVERFFGPGGSYQWSRAQAQTEQSSLTILQVPHFSRANSADKLAGMADWLRGELRPFAARKQGFCES